MLWNKSHIEVKLTNTLNSIQNGSTISSDQLFEKIKLDLSQKEDFDYVIGLGGEFAGKKKASNGTASIKRETSVEVEFEVQFDYKIVSRKDESDLNDPLKKCTFKFKVDKETQIITDYIYG